MLCKEKVLSPEEIATDQFMLLKKAFTTIYRTGGIVVVDPHDLNVIQNVMIVYLVARYII